MKWFKHQSDSHTNLKIKELIRRHKLEGYGFFFLILEFVAKNSENFRISHEKVWKKELQEISKLSQKKMELLLATLTELDLISKISFKKGILSVPKMKEYIDNYYRQTYKQLTSNLQATAKQLTKNKDKDKDIDIDKDKEGDIKRGKNNLLNKFKI